MPEPVKRLARRLLEDGEHPLVVRSRTGLPLDVVEAIEDKVHHARRREAERRQREEAENAERYEITGA